MGNLTNSGSLIDAIEGKQNQLTAGRGINIEDDVISATGGGGGGADWGDIGGTLSDQTDLREALDEKQHILITGNGLAITESKGRRPAKGPCPIGYHIPTNSEWSNIITLFSSMASGPTTSQKLGFLKLPFPGYIDAPDGIFYKGGIEGAYWSCVCNNENQAYCFEIKSNATRNAPWRNATGLPIRPFKDETVEPDPETWTAVYTDVNVSIYREPTEGLISFRRAANIAWTTIADKNIGATIAWNYGDAVTAANCGNMYQWGNNYGFTWGENPAITSTVQIDGGQYSWENPYNSSTFTLSIGQAGYWNPTNYDIWGGQSASSRTEGVYIENAGVTSLNGKVGNVQIRAGTDMQTQVSGNVITVNSTLMIKDSTAPSSPTAGQMWYDTANNELYIYNGTEWKQIAFV